MTVGRFQEVDHDLPADFVGGALGGTPDEAVVARLVDEDPAWAEAYALLAPAVAGVRADLAAWGDPAPEMPAAVTDRIVAALGDAWSVDPSQGDRGEADAAQVDEGTDVVAEREPLGGGAGDGEPDAARSSGAGVLPTQPLGGSGRRPAGVPRSDPGRGGTTGPGRRRRRWTRVAGPVALAAVSIAAVGLGVSQLAGEERGGDAGTALPAPAVDRPEAAPSFRTVAPPTRSDADYTPETLGSPGLSAKARQLDTSAAPRDDVQAEGGRMSAPADLGRLTDPTALNACLREIGTEHGDGPLVVEVVEQARFQGEPALVVRFTDVTGAHWAWVSGPECGIPGSGSDARYRSRVG